MNYQGFAENPCCDGTTYINSFHRVPRLLHNYSLAHSANIAC